MFGTQKNAGRPQVCGTQLCLAYFPPHGVEMWLPSDYVCSVSFLLCNVPFHLLLKFTHSTLHAVPVWKTIKWMPAGLMSSTENHSLPKMILKFDLILRFLGNDAKLLSLDVKVLVMC